MLAVGSSALLAMPVGAEGVLPSCRMELSCSSAMMRSWKL